MFALFEFEHRRRRLVEIISAATTHYWLDLFGIDIISTEKHWLAMFKQMNKYSHTSTLLSLSALYQYGTVQYYSMTVRKSVQRETLASQC